jgi:hypothetical protein
MIAQAAFAQNPTPPKYMTFPEWKDQQVLAAPNLVLRTAARLQQLKAGKGSKTQEPAEVPTTTKLKKMGDSESLSMAELDVKSAQDTLENANKLKFDDYVEVYLTHLQDQPEALQKLSEKLSKEELAEIFKVLVRKPKDDNATRNAALVGGMNLPARSKNP